MCIGPIELRAHVAGLRAGYEQDLRATHDATVVAGGLWARLGAVLGLRPAFPRLPVAGQPAE